jgi:hypothetical protein
MAYYDYYELIGLILITIGFLSPILFFGEVDSLYFAGILILLGNLFIALAWYLKNNLPTKNEVYS